MRALGHVPMPLVVVVVVVSVAVIEVSDMTDVTLSSFVSTMESRLAAFTVTQCH